MTQEEVKSPILNRFEEILSYGICVFIKRARSGKRFLGRTWPSADVLKVIFQEKCRNPVLLSMGGCQGMPVRIRSLGPNKVLDK